VCENIYNVTFDTLLCETATSQKIFGRKFEDIIGSRENYIKKDIMVCAL